MKFKRFLSLTVMLCIGPSSEAWQTPGPSLDKAFVNIKLNTAYDDSEQSLFVIRTIARYVPVRSITVSSGDTLDALFVREYGFGKSDLPRSYALLIPIILEKNHLARAEELRPGTLVIPTLPKRALMGWGRNNPLNYVANMFVLRAASATSALSASNRSPIRPLTNMLASAASELAFKEIKPTDEPRPSAPTALISVEVGVRQAIELLESKAVPPQTFEAGPRSMPVNIAADDNCDTEPASRDHATLSPEQRATISQLLRQGSQRSPLVFILDTGWPSLDAYKESTAALNDVLDTVWRRAFNRPFSKSQPQRTLARANHGHCRCIERALKELRGLDAALDPSKRVRIAYLPLTREQGADSVLSDLLTTSILLQRVSRDHGVIDDKIVVGSRKQAISLVAGAFPAKWVGNEVVTDKSILDAILLIGQVYALESKTVFFANESWTVKHPPFGGKYYVGYQTPQYGLVIAATGNDGTSNLLDFAQRASLTSDTMAVLNMNAAGVDKTSTRVPPADIDAAVVAGFDGYVTDDVFGTSFSAPRIAWFLAAGEALRTRSLQIDRWTRDVSEQLKGLRNSTATDEGKLLFDPIRYLQAQIGPPVTSTR